LRGAGLRRRGIDPDARPHRGPRCRRRVPGHQREIDALYGQQLEGIRCETCSYCQTTIEFRPALQRQRDHAQQLGQRERAAKILLDIEYSDSPTSSAAQATPAAWAGQSLPGTVRAYTESVIKAFALNGTPVAQVAIGNEI
jgi:hypothetical protein